MDFWSRLIGGAGNHKHQLSPAQSPQQRLQRFRRAYTPVLQICSRPQSKASSGQALEQLRISLQRIAAILREESRTPAPHLCLSFAASSQIYSVVGRAASASQNETVIREAIAVFGILVDCEEEDFLMSAVFAKSLMRFVARVTDSASIGDDTEAELIEVLFGVAAKIRVQPDILPVWFNTAPRPSPQRKDTVGRDTIKSFAGDTQKNDFPLCYLLIDRIHHEGRTGDFARTGLLYIFEAVSHSPDLEDWIIRSDLPTLMASGLGALYSQLSRELSIRHEPQHLPLILALSDYVHAQPVASAENIFSKSHANHVSTFLSHLAFWQDVLEHCKSDHVKQTLLDHFQILFLQQLLYPSLLQSSDTDGGSSVAVLTYIANILDALDHQDLVHMILTYLLAIPDPVSPDTALDSQSPTATRRQSSLDLLNGSSIDEEKVDPNLFSLVDLILNGVNSQNPQTAVAALKLSSVLLNRHTTYAITTLVKAVPSSNVLQRRRTVGALSVESESLMSIAASVSYDECLDDAYTTALQDIVAPLEAQMIHSSSDRSPPMALASNDPFLVAISNLFQSFFTNNVDVNLALTEAVMHLALQTRVSLDGWLTVPPSKYCFDGANLTEAVDPEHLDEEEQLALHGLYAAHRRPHWENEHAPLLPRLLRQLQTQLEEIRVSVANVDTLIAKRIEILGGIEKDGPVTRPASRTAPSRVSSEGAAEGGISYRPGESRQIERLRSESAAESRKSSPARSPTPSRVRELAASPSRSRDPSTNSTSSHSDRGRLSRAIFQPPPHDAAEDGTNPTRSREHEAETLQRKLRFRCRAQVSSEGFHFVTEGVERGWADEEYEEREASTSHVLTNIVVLHYFLLDLVAVLQTRAILVDQVDFS